MIPTVENKGAVILNSGGIDSRVLAKLAKDAGYTLHSLFIDANKQISPVSIPAAKKTAELYCEDHHVFDFPEDWTMEKAKGIFGIPYLAMMSHSIGSMYTLKKGFDTLFAGARSQGRSQKYLDSLNYCLNNAIMTRPIQLLTPIFNKTFDDVQIVAKNLSIPLEDTYSCNRYPACGRCRVCLQRKKVGLN